MLTRGAQVTGVAVCSLCLTWISVSARFYVRIKLQKFIGREDWLTFVAMILFTTLCALLLRATDYGLGAHMYAIPEDMMETGLKYIFISELLYVVTTAVVKLAIGVYFLRLSSKKYQTRVIFINLAVVMVFSTIYFFFLLFQCHPVNYLWMQYTDSNGSCLSSKTLANVTYAHAAMSAATDWVFGILPVFFVWRLKMNPRTKLSVILILSLGFFASSATIVRIVYIRQLEIHADYSWFGINLVKWSIVEPAIAITAAAIATLRPLFKNFLNFTNRQFANEVESSFADSTRRSGDTKHKSWRGDQFYSPEFAEMLGLSRYGVTTTITAVKPPTWREKRRMARRQQNERQAGHSESQTELNDVKEDETPPEWTIAVTREMTIVIDE